MLSCKKCGAALFAEGEKCGNCGFSESSPTSAPQDGLPKFKHIPILVMLALFIVTGGLYSTVWFLFRRDDLDQIAYPPFNRKAGMLINFYVCSQLALYLVAALWGIGYELAVFFSAFSFLLAVISIYLALLIRDILRIYVARTAPDNPLSDFVAPSILWTCLFGVFYLQSHINKLIDAHFFEERI